MINVEPFDIVLIIIITGIFVIGIVGLVKVIKEGFLQKWNIVSALVFGALLVSYLIHNLLLHRIEPTGWAQIFLTLGLIVAAGLYALVAFRQATASVKMAEEMREQRYDTVRPVIDIQREPRDEDKLPEAVAGKSGDTSRGLVCVLRNIGLGPAIDMHSFVQNPFVQNPSDRRQRFEFGTLAAGEKSVLTMSLSLEQEDSRIALVVYYKDVYGRTFESSREVRPDEEKSWQVSPLQIRLIEESKPK